MNTNNDKFEILQNGAIPLNIWRCPTETRMHLICAMRGESLYIILDICGDKFEVNNNSTDEMIALFDDCGEHDIVAGYNFVCDALRWIEDHTSDDFKERVGDAAFLRVDAENAFKEWRENCAENAEI